MTEDFMLCEYQDPHTNKQTFSLIISGFVSIIFLTKKAWQLCCTAMSAKKNVCWCRWLWYSHLLRMRFGKIITIHGVENNICECFPHIRYLHLNGVVLCSHFIRDVSEQTFKPERASAPRVHTSHTQKHSPSHILAMFLWFSVEMA